MDTAKILIFTATYNERENIVIWYEKIKSLNLDVDMLIVDDNSPDGTGKVIDELAAKDPHVHTIHRPKKMGLGTAHIAAYQFAQEHNYDLLITMDADLTHDPKYIPTMLEKITDADIVIGSRYTQGGSMKGWNTIRLPLTYFWRNVIKHGLNLPYDCTGAYRVYRTTILQPHVYGQVDAKGFAFCIESLYRFVKHGARVKEVPITAYSRIHGTSKLSAKIMSENVKTVFKLMFDRITSPKPTKNYGKV